MVMSGSSGLRQQGVVPTSRESKTAPPKTLTNCVEMKIYAVEMGNQKGEKVITLLMKVGETLFMDPDGEAWARKLKPVDPKSWLAAQFAQATAAQGPLEVPKQDDVDVLGGK